MPAQTPRTELRRGSVLTYLLGWERSSILDRLYRPYERLRVAVLVCTSDAGRSRDEILGCEGLECLARLIATRLRNSACITNSSSDSRGL